MSDTTTITPEERARIREIAAERNLLSFRVGIHDALDNLLTALEAAEAALLKEEVYSEELESQLQHAREENERLRAERGWLAERCAELCDEDEHYGFLGHDESVKLWKRKAEEAARRAVADAESEVEG